MAKIGKGANSESVLSEEIWEVVNTAKDVPEGAEVTVRGKVHMVDGKRKNPSALYATVKELFIKLNLWQVSTAPPLPVATA